MRHQQRIWEIDFARGLAIIIMIIFHLIVDLTDFFGYKFNYLSGFWYYFGKVGAIAFIAIAGISACLNRRLLRHGLTIGGWALVLTAVTYVYNPQTYIRFGILHLLSTSIIIYRALASIRPKLLLPTAALICALGPIVDRQTVPTSLLLPLGFTPPSFVTMDYYPLLPWFGVFLLGVSAGQWLGFRPGRLEIRTVPRPAQPITWLGRHSLWIYLLHQPLLLMLLTLLHLNWR